MSNSRTRCRDCGAVTNRSVRVCETCTSTPGTYFHLVSRRDIRRISPRGDGFLLRPSHAVYVYAVTPVATRRRTGELLYWMADVQDTLRRCTYR